MFLLTGDIAERPDEFDTADGKPATRDMAIARLGRMVCADKEEFNERGAMAIADFLAFELSEMLGDAITSVSFRYGLGARPKIILSGHGEFVLNRIWRDKSRIHRLSEAIGSDAARVAPAFAVACLADTLVGWTI